ncbi:S-adenosyl-L-methionine-dependent methyltransferase [Serendipita vermifera]|nr:S-adenosyl-L-methionine-dependent methyltransferase [Serendipita vermifera]
MSSQDQASTDDSLKEEAPSFISNQPPLAVRARYEQSFPRGSGTTGRTNASASIMDRTHDATTVDEAAQSTYSYESTRDWTMFFKEVDGRLFSSQASPYILPADEVEFLRLDKQHAAHLIGLGSLYPCPDLVEQILAPQPGITKEILDLGCGTGIWALSMARQFPHTRVLGIDLAPIPLRDDQLPPNISFEIDDINLGLDHLANRFDLVHMRCVGGGLPDYNQGITYAAQCVKPGGLLLIVDYDIQICAEDMVTTQKMATPNQKDGSWFQRFMYEVGYAFRLNDINTFKITEALDRGLWDHPLLTNCGAASMFNPVGPWATSTDPEEAQRLQFAGILIRQNHKAVTRAFQTLLKKMGVAQDTILEWIALADKDMDELKVHSWIRLCLLWGIRRPLDQDQGQATTEVISEENPTQNQRSNWQSSRTIHVYHTQEESMAARKRRLETIGEVVEPQVLLTEGTRP